MNSKSTVENNGNKLAIAYSIISFTIALVMFMLVLNWFFEITPYQKLEGMPILFTPLICPIGILFGILPIKSTPSKFAKCSIIFNVILIALPFLYMGIGTLVLGP